MLAIGGPQLAQSEEDSQLQGKLFTLSPATRPESYSRLMLPFRMHLKSELGMDTAAPKSLCGAMQIYDRYESALITPPMSMVAHYIDDYNYEPVAMTTGFMSFTVFGKTAIQDLQQLRGKSVSMPKLASAMIHAVFDRLDESLWPSLKPVYFNDRNLSGVTQILNDHVEFGIVNQTQWKMTSVPLREKLHSMKFESPFPRSVWLASPKLPSAEREIYARFAKQLSEHKTIRESMDIAGFGQFGDFDETMLATLRTLQTDRAAMTSCRN